MASLLMYSMRSERVFYEEFEYNLLYRWSLDMDLLEDNFGANIFTKNRQRVLEHVVGWLLFNEVVWSSDAEGLVVERAFQRGRNLDRGDHQLQELPSHGGIAPSTDNDPGNPSVDFRGEYRSNETHASTTDPEAYLLRKGWGMESPRGVPGRYPDGKPPQTADGLHGQPGCRGGTGCGARAPERTPELILQL